MSENRHDPETFDINAYIEGLKPNEVTVKLYPRNREFQDRLEALHRQAAEAEKVTPENRGIGEASAEQVQLLVAELRAEWEASAVPIRLREMRDREIAQIAKDAVEAGASAGDANMHVLSAALVEPNITPEQLVRLRDANVEGEALVAEMAAAFTGLRQGVTAPFSPGS